MRLFLLVLCVLALIGSCSTKEATKFRRVGPHRPVRPRRIPQARKPSSTKTPPPTNCQGEPVRIAVIDTGFGAGWDGEENAHLCKYGHWDFTKNITPPTEYWEPTLIPHDDYRHGTHVAGTIATIANVSQVNYCLIILKYYDPNDFGNVERVIAAINYAKALHANFINFSGGGDAKSDEEVEAVKGYIDGGGTFVAAAGNEGRDLGVHGYYPAMDDPRVIVVGDLLANGVTHNKTSNYGDRVNAWEIGTNLKVYDRYMTGTSMAAAVHTGKMVVQTKRFCK